MYSNDSNSGVMHSFDLEKLPENVDHNQVKDAILESVNGTGVNKLRYVDRDINVFTSKIEVPTINWNKIDIVTKDDSGFQFMDSVIKPALRKIGVDIDSIIKEPKCNKALLSFYSEARGEFNVNENGNVEVRTCGTKTEYSADGTDLLRAQLDRTFNNN